MFLDESDDVLTQYFISVEQLRANDGKLKLSDNSIPMPRSTLHIQPELQRKSKGYMVVRAGKDGGGAVPNVNKA